MAQQSKIKEQIFYVKGMHCPSCEILIEKKLLTLARILSVEASTAKNQVRFEYQGNPFTPQELNQLFKKENYVFSAQNNFSDHTPVKTSDPLIPLILGIMLILAFLTLNKLGLAGFINVNAQSSLPMFFIFGLIAGLSSCAALVGGIILSMSKQWTHLYSPGDSLGKKIQPHLMFNFGRLASYAILGAILGAIGSQLNLSLKFGPILVIIVSLLMILLALQMLGVKALQKFQLSAPKFITRYLADETHFHSRYAPFLMGALTFFLPCGFTITAQGLALISGSALQGGLIMLLFALGTLPMLLTIGLSSVKFSGNAHLADGFLKVAGMLVLFFALFNLNSQLNVLGIASLSDLTSKKANPANNVLDQSDLAPIVSGKQLLKMTASSTGYTPNYFKVRAGQPVRWEITDTGTSGCTNAIISNSLFTGQIPLTPGQVSVKEFTPTKVGKYKFSCWMGMISGTIEVVDQNSPVQNPTNQQGNSDNSIIPSGAKGCGCGGGQS